MYKLIFFLLITSLYSNEDPSYIIGGLYPHRTICGGLGNQLFQVSAACAVAWDHGVEPYFPDFERLASYPEASYQHVFFRCKIDPPSNEISYQSWSPPYNYFPIQYKPKMRTSGHFMNEKYFAHHRDRLLQLFAPREDDLQYIQNKYGWILDHPNSVCIHLRYYYGEVPDEICNIQYDWEYYGKAMDLFPDSSLFVVVTDGIDFAKKNIPIEGRNVVFIENEPHYIDFYLQTLCKHNIICNSTFSWWGAWLNQNPDKIIVRPKIWADGYPDNLVGPDHWIKVDADGMLNRGKRAPIKSSPFPW